MKRKIFSGLLALVLVLSFSLVTAVPVGAQGVVEEFQSSVNGWVKWAPEEAYIGNYSVLLGLADPTDEARVAVPVSMAFTGLTSLSYWYYIKTAALDTVPDAALKDSTEPDFEDFTPVPGYAAPYAVIELDTTGGTAANAWVVEARYADDSIGAWEQRSLGTTNYFHAAGAGVPPELALPNIATLATIQAHGFFDGATVLKVKAMMGDWHAYITNSPEAYIDDIGVNGVPYPLEPKAVVNIDAKYPAQGVANDTSFDTISEAIDDALADQTILVADGTYNENIVIDVEGLTLQAASSPEIDGDGTLTNPAIHVQAASVTVQGFVIQNFIATGADQAGDIGAILVEGDNAKILDNIVRNITCTGTEGVCPAGLGIDISANTVEVKRNEVYDISSIGIRVRARFGEPSTQMTTVLLEGNTVYNTGNSGVLVVGNVTDITIKGNEIYNSLEPTPYSLFVCRGPDTAVAPDGVTIEGNYIHDSLYSNVVVAGVNNVTISGNTITGAPMWSSPGKNIYILDDYLYGTNELSTNIEITNNDIQDGGYGIRILNTGAADPSQMAATTKIKYNDISGNTEYGVENNITTDVDAKYNYWGDPSGPTITTNDRGAGDAVTTNVVYEPWLHTTQATVVAANTRYYAYNLSELKQGWNIWSTPIALDGQAGTWGDYKALGVDLDLASGSNAYYFDASATPQVFLNVTDSYMLKPCDAIYIKMASDQESPILFSPSVSAPAKTLYPDWNLVSASYISNINSPDLTAIAPQTALASVYNVTGANNIGYGQVVSPPVNQTAWSGVRGTDITSFTTVTGTPLMLPTKGYWVYMTNGGTLAGMVFTPVSPLLP